MYKQVSSNKLISSLILFRELYNNKKDIYTIVQAFIKNLIIDYKMNSFTASDVTQKLNNEYEFNIPINVVISSLKKISFLKRNTKKYFLVIDHEELKVANKNRIQHSKNSDSSQELFNKLIEYAKLKSKDTNEIEKTKLTQYFCNYLIDNSNSVGYQDIISSFIIECEKDDSLREKINAIREGYILYSGLQYIENTSELDRWKDSLNIYLSTEILFDIFGLNGELRKRIASEFLDLVNELNSKKKNIDLIKLYYFPEITEEINKYFYSAQKILENNDLINPESNAMHEILKNCVEISSIQEKKVAFFNYLKKVGIIESSESCNITEIEKHKYNLYNKKLIERLNTELKIDDSESYLNILNKISILRDGNNGTYFEKSGHIFLSSSVNMMKISSENEINKLFNVPLVTTLNFVTNRIWLKLHKGLTKNNSFPLASDVFIKSKLILSSILVTDIQAKFDCLNHEYKTGAISKDTMINNINALRSANKKPEDIKADTQNEILDFINSDLDECMRLNDERKQKASKYDQELKENNRNKKIAKNFIQNKKEIESEIEKLRGYLTSTQSPKLINITIYIIISMILIFIIIYNIQVFYLNVEQ